MKQAFNYNVGDVILVSQVDKQQEEGKKDRIANFRGRIIKIRGTGSSKTVTVRQTIEGITVDRILPVESPLIKSVELVEKPKKRIRRARLFKQPKKL